MKIELTIQAWPSNSVVLLRAALRLLACFLGLAASAAELYREPYRPQFHFTPARNWINDPNGLVFLDGEYHLFYQFNPQGDKWGHMSWGHAVTRDLVHWEHLPLALAEENDVMIFSGSAVVDSRNSSGLGQKGRPPLVAIYTGHYTKKPLQNQNLAFSNDRGRTWKKFVGNPILDIKEADFRDPKVFWYEPAKRWVMVVAWPQQRKVRLYGSLNLKEWKHLSDFEPAGSVSGIWECPDLFPLRVPGRDLEKWVLIVNVGSGAPAGGSGTQYFVGDFDGVHFVLDKSFPKGEPEFVPEGDLVVDFEGANYRGWQSTGNAFGTGPASGRIGDQKPVEGFRGKGLVNTFAAGDSAQGTLTSGEFEIANDYLSFLIGGGNHPGLTCLNLSIDGHAVRTATGDNSERLSWKSWDIRELRGKRARLEVVDHATNEWGHILVDHIVLADVAARSAAPAALWADYGPDFYAGVTWSDLPKRDGRRLWLGWMSNWRYAGDLPTSPWRGAMSLPRELALIQSPEGLRLAQEPVEELRKLRDDSARLKNATAKAANDWLRREKVIGPLWEIEAEIQLGKVPASFGFKLLQKTNQGTIISYDTARKVLSLDRSTSGKVNLNPGFADVYKAPLSAKDGLIRLHFFLDAGSVELFGNNGEAVLTSLIFPGASDRPLEFWTSNDAVTLRELNVWKLKSVVPIPAEKR